MSSVVTMIIGYLISRLIYSGDIRNQTRFDC